MGTDVPVDLWGNSVSLGPYDQEAEVLGEAVTPTRLALTAHDGYANGVMRLCYRPAEQPGG